MAMKRTAAFLLPLLLLGCATHEIAVRPLPNAESASVADGQSLAKGRMLFERGEYALATDAFRKAARYDPNSADAYNGLAASYDQLGRYDLSRRYYELALAQAPEDGRILRNFARSMLRQGDAIAARKLVAEAAALAERPAAPDKPAIEAPHQAASSGEGSVTVALEASSQPLPMARPALADAAAPSLFQRISATVTNGLRRSETEVNVAIDPPSVHLDIAAPAKLEHIPRLHVMNAVGRKHQAARMRAYLVQDGWSPVSTGDSRWKLARSRILFAGADADAARKLAQSLPFRPVLQPSRRAPALFLMLGRDAVKFDTQLRSPKQG